MPNLTPSTPSRRPKAPDAPITRVVVVREGDRASKHVRENELPSHFGARTGFWSAIGAGTIVFLWITGHLGESLGFARSLGIDDLLTSADQGLAAGVRMVLAVPLRIFEMTMVDPFRLIAACALIAIPASGLAVSAPRVPGGPAPSKLAQGFSIMGLITAGIVFAILITWIAWPGRRETLVLAPFDRAQFGPWLASVQAVAGFDALALVSAVLWLVLLFRLPLPRIAISFGAVAGFMAAFATWTGFAVSNGIVDGCTRDRPVIMTLVGLAATPADPSSTGAAPTSLLLGTVHGKSTVMGSGERPQPLALDAPEFAVSERATLERWMRPLPTE
ncbi:MAG: hypothetical protein JNL80_10985 [Phycisphaerae bacterium]|jgi:hypothetical protein|nr:hypothetical protein [Phycisphaerae bacterium]